MLKIKTLSKWMLYTVAIGIGVFSYSATSVFLLTELGELASCLYVVIAGFTVIFLLKDLIR